ncbi:SDR family NAD(P)-dependent oxidoreductase [Microbacterium sp. C5A9]|uniref:SDR family NAD(P)-dependent oxidoreductase n=1 Tax=Microbacterium sp. C5A9 TaxID=2736663 RepID=UPI001F524B98|nr:SDR family NAD(P)-dependent oxidoreductase [Microbacterium sp. C5A9]MCI1020140.1 SDR family NAD(P)-dependent oxidoreductase [Microbacterium sp. C5A9]
MALIFVTGTSTGLGLSTATVLAADGHDVVVHARTAARIPTGPWSGTVIGDLADQAQTIDVAHAANAYGRFDAVIHNAGALRAPEAVPVNTLAPYILTAVMITPGRLIYLSSSMHRDGSTDLTGLGSGMGSYSDSKLWVTALSAAVATRWEGTRSHAVDPGWVPTRMGGAGAPDDLVEGHRTQVRLATDPDVTPQTGGYWHHQQTQKPAAAVHDPLFQAELLATLAERTGLALP